MILNTQVVGASIQIILILIIASLVIVDLRVDVGDFFNLISRDSAMSRDFAISFTFIILETSLAYTSISLTLLLFDTNALLEILFISLYRSFIAQLCVTVELVL